MAYTKQNFKSGDTLRASQLNAMDAQIALNEQSIGNKVDKVAGKGLSTNDYTSSDKAKVTAIPSDPKYTDTVYDDTEIRGMISGMASGWTEGQVELLKTILYSASYTSDDVKNYVDDLITSLKEGASSGGGGGSIEKEEIVIAVAKNAIEKISNDNAYGVYETSKKMTLKNISLSYANDAEIGSTPMAYLVVKDTYKCIGIIQMPTVSDDNRGTVVSKDVDDIVCPAGTIVFMEGKNTVLFAMSPPYTEGNRTPLSQLDSKPSKVGEFVNIITNDSYSMGIKSFLTFEG